MPLSLWDTGPGTDVITEVAGYVRVSRKAQADGHSPEVQRAAIRQTASHAGYVLKMLEEDHQRGSNVSREGYQRIIQAARAKEIDAVIVFMFDRWGRDGAEWLVRAKEFDRLGIPLISVQEGRDEGGLMRFVRAGMAEEYSRQLAQRIIPSRERGARSGIHMGPTPLGFTRVYPPYEGQGRRPAGQLVRDDATAGIVQELFDRYAGGGHSIISLVRWLNREYPHLAPNGSRWHNASVYYILKNPTYRGAVRFNQRPQGVYKRAREGTAFIVEGSHEGLIDPLLWDEVQRRLQAASKTGKSAAFNRRETASGRRVALGTGILRCAECGGPMVYLHHNTPGNHGPQYVCMRRHHGSLCTGRGYQAHFAHEALVREVGRLHGAPWTDQAERYLTEESRDSGPNATASLTRALDAERDNLRKHVRRLGQLPDPSPEVLQAFQEVSEEMSGRIKALEAQLARQDQPMQPRLPDLKRIHQQLLHTDLAEFIRGLADDDDTLSLRDIVLAIVESARLVDRRPAINSKWLRFEVVWTPAVQTLLDAGLLWLDMPPEAPYFPTRAERRRDEQRRRRERIRAERAANVAKGSHSDQFLVFSRTVRITSCCNRPISIINRSAS